MKKLQELLNTEEPAWSMILDWLNNAKNHYRILEKNQHQADQEIVIAQVTTRSPMGAVIYETGGILIDYGWLRILGSGNPELNRRIMTWNKRKAVGMTGEEPSYLLVADDVLGGHFAINTGGLGENTGNVFYLAQDTLEWEDMECSYSDFLNWAINGDIQTFYSTFKWSTWKEDLQTINGSQVFSFFPFLWSKEGKNIENVKRSVIPIEDSYFFTLEMMSKL